MVKISQPKQVAHRWPIIRQSDTRRNTIICPLSCCQYSFIAYFYSKINNNAVLCVAALAYIAVSQKQWHFFVSWITRWPIFVWSRWELTTKDESAFFTISKWLPKIQPFWCHWSGFFLEDTEDQNVWLSVAVESKTKHSILWILIIMLGTCLSQ